MKKIVCMLALCLSCLGWISANEAGETKPQERVEKKFAHPDRIRYDGSCMTIDGKDVFIYSAAFHYFRCPEELWRDRFRSIKEAGFNVVETYVPWNWHERTMPADINDHSKLDFADLRRWLTMAQEEFGLYTIVRPGPFICAEWSGGAYPRWLAKFRPEGLKGLWLRGDDPEHIRWSLHWFDAVCKELAEEQITRKPKGSKGIIMIQIENEYNAHWSKGKDVFLKALYHSAVNNGFDVPVFTCLTGECRGSKDPELSQVFDCDNYYVGGLSDAPSCAYRMSSLRKVQPDAPGYVTELQGGWFSLVTQKLSEEHFADERSFRAIGFMSILGGSTGLNYYMYVGGTHIDGWGARGMTTTYDYNAAIRESGARGPKFYASREIGQFIQANEQQLVRSEGGICAMEGAPKSLFGGIRVATDGTKFIFLHNTDEHRAIKGTTTLVPGTFIKPSDPIYNIDQNGQKVLIQTEDEAADSLTLAPFEVDYDLPALAVKVLVVPPGKDLSQGEWWPKEQMKPLRPANMPEPVRIASVRRMEDPYEKAAWNEIAEQTSLSDLDINDFRYNLYRSQVKLTAGQATKEKYLLFNMFTRDIVSVTVNGQQAVRLFPDKADAQTWTTRNCFDRIRPDEFDNRFDVSGLLKKGMNDIVVVYESLGHAHGYVPMEELAGIRQAGLSDTDKVITHPLEWKFAADPAGITLGWTEPDYPDAKWEVVKLNTTGDIPRKGNEIQPREVPDGLFTWYRVEFELPEQAVDTWIPWLARINASGNGYMWLNGHNIGRHWEAGPQRDFYLPECWLNFGGKKNVLVFGLRQTGNGAAIKAMQVMPYPDSAEIGK